MAGKKRMLRKYDGMKLNWMRTAKRFTVVVVVLVLLFRFVIGMSVVSGVSMRTTLKNGDILFYSRIYKDLNYGDIIALSLPSGEYYVKRVVAKGGDEVDVKDGVLYINGQPEGGTYYRGKTYMEEGTFTYPFIVPEGDVFTLGDNREESIDSRFYGSVNLRQVKGVVKLRLGMLYAQLF